MKCCVWTDVGTWTNWLTFEPDPDYSPDAGTGLLSPLSYKRWYAEFYVGKIRHIRTDRCSDAWFHNGFIHWASEPSKHLCRRYMRSTECPSRFLCFRLDCFRFKLVNLDKTWVKRHLTHFNSRIITIHFKVTIYVIYFATSTMSNISKMVQDSCTYNGRLIWRLKLYRMVPYLVNLNDHNPDFKSRPLFDVEYLRNRNYIDRDIGCKLLKRIKLHHLMIKNVKIFLSRGTAPSLGPSPVHLSQQSTPFGAILTPSLSASGPFIITRPLTPAFTLVHLPRLCCATLRLQTTPEYIKGYNEITSWQVTIKIECDLQRLCNSNFYDQSCCTSRCKARIATLMSLASTAVAKISRGPKFLGGGYSPCLVPCQFWS